MQLPEGLRPDQLRPALPLAGVPSGPAGEVEHRHVGGPGGPEDRRVVAVGAGEESLGLAVDLAVAHRGVDLAQRGLRPEACRPQAQRREDSLRDQLFPRLAADPLEDGARDDIVHVRIGELRSRLRRERLHAPLPTSQYASSSRLPSLGHRLPEQVPEGVVVARDAAGVRQELRERHPPQPGIHLAPQVREDLGEGRIPPELPLPQAWRRAARSSPWCRIPDGSGRAGHGDLRAGPTRPDRADRDNLPPFTTAAARAGSPCLARWGASDSSSDAGDAAQAEVQERTEATSVIRASERFRVIVRPFGFQVGLSTRPSYARGRSVTQENPGWLDVSRRGCLMYDGSTRP